MRVSSTVGVGVVGSFPPKTLDKLPGGWGIVLLLNSVYSGLQNSCHECGLRRKNGCGQPKHFRAELASLPNQNL